MATTPPPLMPCPIKCAVFGPMDNHGYDVQIHTPSGIVFVEFDSQFIPCDISRATLNKCEHYARSQPAPMEVTDEMAAFKESHSHLDLMMTKDAWGRDCFYHSMVQAIWEGWRARAAFRPWRNR